MKRLRYHLGSFGIVIFIAVMIIGLYFMGWTSSRQPLSSYNRDKLASFKHLLHID